MLDVALNVLWAVTSFDALTWSSDQYFLAPMVRIRTWGHKEAKERAPCGVPLCNMRTFLGLNSSWVLSSRLPRTTEASATIASSVSVSLF